MSYMLPENSQKYIWLCMNKQYGTNPRETVAASKSSLIDGMSFHQGKPVLTCLLQCADIVW